MTKKHLLLAFALLVCCTKLVTAQQFATPVKYLEFISTENNKLNNQVWQYTKAVAHDKRPRKIEKTRMLLVRQIQQSRTKIKNTKGYDNDTTYRDQFINFLDIYENVINNDYAKIVDMKEIAEQSYDYMEAYILMQEQVDKKMEDAFDQINVAEKEFAKKYNINLVDGEESSLSKKMKISNEVFQHKNTVYLPFFKANFQESELITSISSQNLGEIQQKTAALLSFAQEGLDSIAAVKPYKNDSSLIKATNEILLFYKDEAENKIPSIIEFLLLNDKVTKLQAAIENKKPKDRTKEDIDEYNAMVNKLNSALTAYNKTNNDLNNKRSKLLQNWENVSNNFLSKHVPKN